MNTLGIIITLWLVCSLPAGIIAGKCLKRLNEVESRELLRERGLI